MRQLTVCLSPCRCTPPRCPCTASWPFPARAAPMAMWTRVRGCPLLSWFRRRLDKLADVSSPGDRGAGAWPQGLGADLPASRAWAVGVWCASFAVPMFVPAAVHRRSPAACLPVRVDLRAFDLCAAAQTASASSLMTSSRSCWSWCWRWWGTSGTRACCAPPCSTCCTSRWATCR